MLANIALPGGIVPPCWAKLARAALAEIVEAAPAASLANRRSRAKGCSADAGHRVGFNREEADKITAGNWLRIYGQVFGQ